jgi:glucan phosphoethanolaminetransferase (alkaline phosphatase superfamily)
MDADKVIISADHGEMFGELGQFGHPESIPHPKLKKVPWVETTASDKKTRHPEKDFKLSDDYDLEEKLINLGYLER